MVRSRKSAEVLESAKRLFLERGFVGTTVEDIAAAANVSKATVYSNFRDKEELLTALLDQVSGDAAAIAAAAFEPLAEDGPLEERLQRVALALVDGVLQPQVVQLRRLAIAEAARHPAATKTYWDRGPALSLMLLERGFMRLTDSGQLGTGAESRLAAEQFAYALLGPLQDRMLLVSGDPLSADERLARVTAVVRRFLAAWRP
jgi:TetR/AcrR family transcriptional regulator, mexJK operon transcriptional repressor